MTKEQYLIRRTKKDLIISKAKELLEETDLVKIKLFLDDCILMNYFPKEVKLLTKKWFVEDIKKLNSDILRLRKSGEKTSELNLRRGVHIDCKIINEFKCYKFCYDLGAFLYHEGIYARTHKEAWKFASERIEDEYGSLVLSVFCVSIDEERTNALSNMNGMFTPKNEGINGVKADDLLKNWKKEN